MENKDKQSLDESLLKMQKLAGIITEQEYNTLIKENSMNQMRKHFENWSEGLEELKLLSKNKGYNV